MTLITFLLAGCHVAYFYLFPALDSDGDVVWCGIQRIRHTIGIYIESTCGHRFRIDVVEATEYDLSKCIVHKKKKKVVLGL